MTTMNSSRFRHFLFVLFGVATLSAVGLGLSTRVHEASAIACTNNVVKTVTATPLNDSKYSVKVSWTKNYNPCTYNHFRIQWSQTTTKNAGTTATASPHTISGLVCGKSYHFWVVAEGPYNGNIGTIVAAPTTPKAPCPSIAAFTVGHSGSKVIVTWSSTTAPKATSSKIEITGGTVSPVSPYAATTSPATFTGHCGTTYGIYVTPKAGTQYGIRKGPLTVKTDNCPPPPKPPSGGGSSSHGSSGGHKTPVPAPAPAPAKPGVPADFVATIQSSKVVQLNWSGVTTTGETSYQLDRSTDNNNWALLATTGDISYKDDTTDFNTTYYYRLKALDSVGNSSDYTTAQATTEGFKPSDNKITSDDKAAIVTIPADAFSQQVDCSFDANAAGNAPTLPKDKLLLRGPYGLLCVGEDGFTVSDFAKPLKVTVKVPAGAYINFDVRQGSDESWTKVKSTYDPKKRELSFDLTAATFAAFGQKQKSIVGTIFTWFLWLLLLAGAAFAVRWFLMRRGSSQGLPVLAGAGAATAATSDVATEQFETAALKPSCTHLNMAHQVQPQSAGCAECEAEHKHWKALRICLTCGHVGCSDDSDEQHARKHFEQTGHPLIYEYGNPAGDTIGWCYIDQTYI